MAAVARSDELEHDGAEVVDLAGRLLVPGFQDAHAHPLTGGANLLAATCRGSRQWTGCSSGWPPTPPPSPDDAWVMGGGWDREVFPRSGPTREQLDAGDGRAALLLRSYDCHGAWVNSEALRIAGVDRDTPDPEHGFFMRDAGGKPTGMLEERAIGVVLSVCPAGEHRGPGARPAPRQRAPAVPGHHVGPGRDRRGRTRHRRPDPGVPEPADRWHLAGAGSQPPSGGTRTAGSTRSPICRPSADSWKHCAGSHASSRTRSRSWSTACPHGLHRPGRHP